MKQHNIFRSATLLLAGIILVFQACKKDTELLPPEKEPVYEFFVEGKIDGALSDTSFSFRVGEEAYQSSSIVGFDKTFSFLFSSVSQLKSKDIRLGNTEPFPIYGLGFKLNFGNPGFFEEEHLSKEELEELLRPGTYEIGNIGSGVELYLDLGYTDSSDSSNIIQYDGLQATTFDVEKAGTFRIQNISEFSYDPPLGKTIYGKKVEAFFDCTMRVVNEDSPREIVIREGHGVFFVQYR